ncbi:MAG: T9SS type A sorting domain-containing protein [Sediminicola sp.]
MRINLLLFLFCAFAISSLNAQEQYEITFGYDNAGNQILRDRVCVNCQTASKTAIDSTKVEIMEEEIAVLKEDTIDSDFFKIVAYPNPVTDILRVEWVASDNGIQQITLFSLDNRQLFQKIVKDGWNGLNLDFNGYPPGSYIVLVGYADGSKKSFQVIKK